MAALLACGSSTTLKNKEGADAVRLAKAAPADVRELVESVGPARCTLMCDVLCSEGIDTPSSCTGRDDGTSEITGTVTPCELTSDGTACSVPGGDCTYKPRAFRSAPDQECLTSCEQKHCAADADELAVAAGKTAEGEVITAEAELPRSSTELEAMNAKQLKALLRSNGLDTKGTKVSLPHGCRATKSDGCRNGRGALICVHFIESFPLFSVLIDCRTLWSDGCWAHKGTRYPATTRSSDHWPKTKYHF